MVMDQINKYKQYIVVAGFLVGAAFIFELLPKTTETFGLDENVRFVYLGVIGLALYTFHTFYWGGATSHINIQRNVPSRSLSDPRVGAGYQQQRRTGAPPPPQQQPAQADPNVEPTAQPPKQVWDTFNR